MSLGCRCSVSSNQIFLCSFSETPGTSASLSFSGEAVALYGTVSPFHANIHITLDGHSLILPGGAGGRVSALRPQVSEQGYISISEVFTELWSRYFW